MFRVQEDDGIDAVSLRPARRIPGVPATDAAVCLNPKDFL